MAEEVTITSDTKSKDNSTAATRTTTNVDAHLFVLVHGLWGSPTHMLTIEKLIKDLVPPASNEKILTLRPQSFRFWKTYDGLELNSKKIITEILYEIETLKEKNNYNVVKISFVGYSLGGLIARYVIGLLQEMDFFDSVKPIFFTTFATPHVGIEFFANNFFDNTANLIGPILFGPVGKELFVADTSKALKEMADPNKVFFQGLARFEKHMLLANVKNDRTVAFFTAFITEYSPFDDWKSVKIKYIKDLPQTRVGKVFVGPKFVDLTRSQLLTVEDSRAFKGNLQEETSIFKTNIYLRVLVIIAMASILVPIWIPLVLTTSFYVSVYSMIKIRLVTFPKIKQHWSKVKDTVYGKLPIDLHDTQIGEEQRLQRRSLSRHESFKGDTSQLTQNAMDNFMYVEERFTGKTPPVGNGDDEKEEEEEEEEVENEPTPTPAGVDEEEELESKSLIDVKADINDEIIKAKLNALSIKDTELYPLFTEKSKLKMNDDKRFIIHSLNSLDWIKIPVYLDCWNAHDGIVSRKGPRSNAKGTSTIGLWCSILRNHLKETSPITT
ncbi:putative serine esterase [Scheffersomyces coipomensis]|uniref:putative serine esterase n=1 Tax=Scheffersomyces coipomensis TaxID=1788519 RepID=UPI00315D3F33